MRKKQFKAESKKLMDEIPNRIEAIIASIDALHRFYQNGSIWDQALPGPDGCVFEHAPHHAWKNYTTHTLTLPCVGDTMAELATELVRLTRKTKSVWEFMRFYRSEPALFDNEVYGVDIVKEIYVLTDGSLAIWESQDDFASLEMHYDVMKYQSKRVRINVLEDN